MAPRVKNSVQKVTKCHVLNRGSRDRNEISARRIKNNKNKIEPFVLWNQNKQRESHWINFCNKKEAFASFLLNGSTSMLVLEHFINELHENIITISDYKIIPNIKQIKRLA